MPQPDAASGFSLGSAVCRVCGQGFADHGAAVCCPACLAPHHKDCWEYNAGCATYACAGRQERRPPPARAGAPGGPPPDKIPFPVLRAGVFLGVFFVTPATVVLTVVAELVALIAFASGALGTALPAAGLMLFALLWAAVTSEVYNVDVKGARLSRSKLVLGRELLEWGVCPLADLEGLELEWCRHEGRLARRLVAFRSSGRPVVLTPPFDPGGVEAVAMDELLYKIESATTLRVNAGRVTGPPDRGGDDER